MAQSSKHTELVRDISKTMREEFRLSILWSGVIADEVGLHVTDAIWLMYLREKESATAGELAEVAGLTTGAMTAAINRLVRAGWVKRTHDRTDKRKVIVQLVSMPTRFKTLRISAEKDLAKIYSAYTEPELKNILAFKRQMNAFVKKIVETFRNKKL